MNRKRIIYIIPLFILIIPFMFIFKSNASDLTLISNLDEFKEMANSDDDNLNVKLLADIEVDDNTYLGRFNPFIGTFDGNGHTITFDYESNEAISLFGSTSNVEIKNLNVIGNITSYESSAALVLEANNSLTIRNCNFNVNVYTKNEMLSSYGVFKISNGEVNIYNSSFMGILSSSDYMLGESCTDKVGIYNSYFAYKNESSGAIAFSNEKIAYDLSATYYLASIESEYGKDITSFKNGYLAYMLNEGLEDIYWLQTIGTDIYPTSNQSSDIVYKTYYHNGDAYYGNNKLHESLEDIDQYLIDGVCSICDMDLNCVHEYVHHASRESTCEVNGNIEYYICSKCNTYFDSSYNVITYAQTKKDLVSHSFIDDVCEYCGTYNGDTIKIKTEEDFEFFSKYISKNNNINAILENDITLNNLFSVGLSATYNGKFNGNNHKITLNIKIDPITLENSELYQNIYALFSNTGADFIVSNLTVAGSFKTDSTGVLCGIVNVNNGVIEGCVNEASIEGLGVYGICNINNGTITNSINKGSLKSRGNIAGICRENRGIVNDSSNEAKIESIYNGSKIAGIAISNYDTITTCINYGNISVTNTNTSYGAGISYCGYSDSIINLSVNTGLIIGRNVCGILNSISGENVTISNSFSSSNIVKSQYKDGITTSGANIINSYSISTNTGFEIKNEYIGNGVLCALLNYNLGEDLYKQTLGVMTTPEFDGSKVYYGFNHNSSIPLASNTEITNLHGSVDNHDNYYEDGKCSICGVIHENHTFEYTYDSKTHSASCDICGYEITNNHNYTITTVISAASCTSEGLTRYTCSCGYYYDDVINMLDHTYSDDYSFDDEYHYFEATCGCNIVSGKEIHQFKDYVTTKEATCLSSGEKYKECELCGYKKYETIEALGHSYSTDYTFNETSHWFKSTCSHNIVSALESHTFSEYVVIKEPTVLETGLKSRSCSKCGYTQTVVIDILSHVHEYSATYTYDDTYHYKEPLCTDTTELFDYAKHEFTRSEVLVPATESSDGILISYCKCGYSITRVIPSTSHEHTFNLDYSYDDDYHWHSSSCGHDVVSNYGAHSFGEWIRISNPSCLTNGLERKTCSECGYSITREVNALGHTYSTVLSYDDNYHYYSATCEHSTEKTQIEEHIYTEYVVISEPTYKEVGYEQACCDKCGYVHIVEIPKVAHEHSYVSQIVAVSDSTDGFTRHVCSLCDEYYDDSFIDKNDYIFNQAVSKIESDMTLEELFSSVKMCLELFENSTKNSTYISDCKELLDEKVKFLNEFIRTTNELIKGTNTIGYEYIYKLKEE